MCKLHFSVRLTIYWASFKWKKSAPTISELPVIALRSQVDWWRHELDCVTLSYKRLLDHKLDIVHKLLMWQKWWHHLLSPFATGYHRFKSLQVSTSSPQHVFLAGVGTKSFLPVTSCHNLELSILVKMRTAGRFFSSFY